MSKFSLFNIIDPDDPLEYQSYVFVQMCKGILDNIDEHEAFELIKDALETGMSEEDAYRVGIRIRISANHHQTDNEH